MGTNFYWYEKPLCECCGRKSDPIHIGKSSYGWVFALHIYPQDAISNLNDWKRLFVKDGSYIEDEYGHGISVDKMISIIEDRTIYKSENGKELSRSPIDGWHCVDRGDICDYFIGEFE